MYFKQILDSFKLPFKNRSDSKYASLLFHNLKVFYGFPFPTGHSANYLAWMALGLPTTVFLISPPTSSPQGPYTGSAGLFVIN